MRSSEALQLRDAMLDHGMPAYASSILHCLIRHSESRWRCRIGLRAIGKECAMSVNSVQKHARWMELAFIIRRTVSEKERCEYIIEAPRVWKTELFRVDKRRFRKPKLLKSVSKHGTDAVSNYTTDVCQITKQIT